eukprot:SAG11_NODE_35176_length_268_cov_0.597633_1_plen_24_part_10
MPNVVAKSDKTTPAEPPWDKACMV